MWAQDEPHTFRLRLGEWTDTWGCIMDSVHHREIPSSIFDFPSRLLPLPCQDTFLTGGALVYLKTLEHFLMLHIA